MDNLVIRTLTTMEELHHMKEVETAVWQMSPLPVHQTFTAINNGGIILGAFDGKTMIGFLYSFAGFDGHVPYLCSHMLGILPAYRTAGLGVKMKLKQAELARNMGYQMITWTFDPLESRNAYLNLHKLGATGSIYKENYYGSMTDELNQGLPTDRIHIKWDINKNHTASNIPFTKEKLLLDTSPKGSPLITDIFYSNPFKTAEDLYMAIPSNFQEIKQADFQLAKKWRMETRKVFQALFENGYQARDLIKGHTGKLNYYAFTHKK
ncbi:putative GNAT superfamily acetyltransferase [Virgibacillus natechei]|uniref:GNAT superfamily acetyltransferase n=1 Tax=Virgibacillus natechei TaxID=1216297 RepID=A0ABS4IJM4_9BACI|nr:GNAT family N-acetyltransferase [Virgibacillus natechei]MBP1970775.1 putative GNAT superfamily acetyltransferase [Virgibacillus natechei]UZD12323.1 GNAT family N-acetyltransferase [Virgibacillus natechei]